MVRDGVVLTPDGREIPLRVDTICVHGDTPGAPDLTRRIRAGLEAAGITVRSLCKVAGTQCRHLDTPMKRLLLAVIALFVFVAVHPPRWDTPAAAARVEVTGLASVYNVAAGAVRDTNGDGLADTVAARVILPPDPTVEDIQAAANIAGRLGFETTALTLPVVLKAPRRRAARLGRRAHRRRARQSVRGRAGRPRRDRSQAVEERAGAARRGRLAARRTRRPGRRRRATTRAR